jgi:hypothetical protein
MTGRVEKDHTCTAFSPDRSGQMRPSGGVQAIGARALAAHTQPIKLAEFSAVASLYGGFLDEITI